MTSAIGKLTPKDETKEDGAMVHADEMPDNVVMNEDKIAPIEDNNDDDDNDDDHMLTEDGSTSGNDGSPQIGKEKHSQSSVAFMEDILGSISLGLSVGKTRELP